jgi:hypothetical protein
MFLLYITPILNACFIKTIKRTAILLTHSQRAIHFIKNLIHNFHPSYIYFYI